MALPPSGTPLALFKYEKRENKLHFEGKQKLGETHGNGLFTFNFLFKTSAAKPTPTPSLTKKILFL